MKRDTDLETFYRWFWHAVFIALGLAIVLIAGCGAPKAASPAGPTLAKRCYSAGDCRQRCESGDGESCLRLAELLDQAVSGHAAAGVLQALCASGDGRGCYRLATMAPPSSARRWRLTRAAREAARAGCELGRTAACALKALIALREHRPTARNLLVWACRAGHAESCKTATLEMARDDDFGDWELFEWVGERHEELREQGCRGGRAEDCLELATWRGDPALRARARALLSKECAAGFAPSCPRRSIAVSAPEEPGWRRPGWRESRSAGERERSGRRAGTGGGSQRRSLRGGGDEEGQR